MVVAKHSVTDAAKLAEMVKAMRDADGWPQGMPPVLVAGENEALTGSHRVAAAEEAAIDPLLLNVQDAVEALVEEGYSWEDLIFSDDEQLADAFRAIGRDDLAMLC